jgi:hypothetical protein
VRKVSDLKSDSKNPKNIFLKSLCLSAFAVKTVKSYFTNGIIYFVASLFQNILARPASVTQSSRF